MASTSDPLATLQAALTVAANSAEQNELLAVLRETLELQPAPIPVLLSMLFATTVNAADSLIKRWVLDLLQYSLCRSSLSLDEKTKLSLQVLDDLNRMLDDPTAAIVKVAIQCLTAVYPLLFRHLCSARANPVPWQTLSAAKARILSLVEAPGVRNGIRVSAVKFMQRAVLVHTRGVSDPRLQVKTDPNIAFCPPDHPFISAAALESEGQHMLQTLVALVLTSSNVDILSALINSWASLSKQRPAMTSLIINTLSRWTPAAIASQSASSIKSIEKAIRLLLLHLARLPNNANFAAQLNEVITQQATRMDKAAVDEKKRRLDSKKRALPDGESPADPKRVKLEPEPVATFDFTAYPASLITELIVANLEAFTEPQLIALVQAYRDAHSIRPPPEAPSQEVPPVQERHPSPPLPAAAAAAPVASTSTSAPLRTSTPPVSQPPSAVPVAEVPPPAVKVEDAVDPLKMDIDQDEMEFEPDRLNEELSGPLPAETDVGMALANSAADGDFKLHPRTDLSDTDRLALVNQSIKRIWTGAEEIRASFVDAGVSPDSQISSVRGATDMSMLLLVRMITRVVRPPSELTGAEGEDEEYYQRQDSMRQTLCDYIMADFGSRIRIATTWMNEEWYNDQIRQQVAPDNWRSNYEPWLNQIVSHYQTNLDGKDKSFSRFLLDLPDVPSDILGLLRELCVEFENPSKMQVGFLTLRGFVIQRPALRSEALTVLLELTTHADKKIRGAAINTVKTWVPNHQPMDTMIRVFALQMLRKLQRVPEGEEGGEGKEVGGEGEGEGEGGQKKGGDGDMSMKVDGEAAPPTVPALPIQDEEMKDETETGKRQEEEKVKEEVIDKAKEPEEEAEREREEGEEDEDGQLPPEDLVHTPYLPERIQLPAQRSDVLQHVELLFALSVKVPVFLEEIFSAYGQMDVTVQEAIQDLLTPLIRSLGSAHEKLLKLMRHCPPGAETLALRVLTIFTGHGRPSPQLVKLVKALINERDLDARFLIPIIAEMDKTDIIHHLPRIVGILNGEAESKNLVRSVFSSIVTTPSQTFGSVTSNLPRVRQSELLTPAELMVLLHEKEKEIGIKSAVEAIGICFSMADVYRSEILGVVMQQIMDETVLPVVFLRTVIQAVTTYKSLIGFVSTTLLSRLITKKIWTNPPLWEGFIRCAKVIAPASFNALLQLPKEQLRELVDKQPTLKSGLRDFVMKKTANKAKVSAFLDIFGDAEGEGDVAMGVASAGEVVPVPVQAS